MDLPPPWELRESARYPGRCYYFNVETCESTWVRPFPYPGHRDRIWPTAIYVLHILVKYHMCEDRDPGITRTRSEAHERAKTVWSDLLKGSQQFEEAAKLHSEDLETRDSGGVIGWIQPKMMPPEFEEIAWQLRIGEMSTPIMTRLGWHLILRRG
jgi:hypothetical protein